MKTAVLLLVVATGCEGGADVVPYPEENTALPTFQGTSSDDVWYRTAASPASYLHWDGEAWSSVADVVYDGDWDGPTDESEMAWSVVGPETISITQYNGQILTLGLDGERTELGKPLDGVYSGAFSVTGHDGVVYAYEPYAGDVPEGRSPLFRRDDDGWTELPAPTAGMDGGVLWATGPDVLWLFRPDSTSVFDGAEWYDYPDVALTGAPQSWLAVAPTRLAAAALDGWAVWRIDTETFTQVPLEDPVGDAILPRHPVAVLSWNGDVALVVERPKDKSFSQVGSKEQETIEAWPLDADGFSGGSTRLERWTNRCKVTETVHCAPGASPPSYLADGTAIAPFVDGLHLWRPR